MAAKKSKNSGRKVVEPKTELAAAAEATLLPALAVDDATIMSKFSVSGTITIDDIVTIAMSNTKTRINEIVKEKNHVCRKLRDEIDKADTEIRKDSEKLIKERYANKLDQLSAAAKELGFEVTLGTPTVLPIKSKGDDDDKKTKQHMIRMNINIRKAGGETSYGGMASQSVEMQAPKELLTKLRQAYETVEQLEVAEKEALDFKMRQSRVPELVEHYRARLAAIKLSQSEDGQKLLEGLTDNIDFVLAQLAD